jgi:LysM repeat protein
MPRVGVVAGPVVAGAMLLASCGGSSDSGATQSTIDLSQASTAFVVRPPATTVPGLTVDGVAVVVTEEQEYVIQSGDYPLKLANDFNVSVSDLVAYNEWGSADEFPGIGTTIKIPPGATAVAAVSNAEGDSAAVIVEGSGDGDPDVTVVTIPDAGDNCAAGSYTIADGDFEQKVADKFDVELTALRAANRTTSGYSSFYVGLEIVIPAKSDC